MQEQSFWYWKRLGLLMNVSVLGRESIETVEYIHQSYMGENIPLLSIPDPSR